MLGLNIFVDIHMSILRLKLFIKKKKIKNSIGKYKGTS
jgi:hypothetical protein